MRKVVIFVTTFLMFIIPFMNVASAQINSHTFFVNAGSNNWSPFSYLEDGVIKGSAYEITKEVLEHAGIPFEYKVQPWARVYHRGTKEENYLISGIGRTHKREKLFHWIGPLTKGVDIFFYKAKSNPIHIKNIEDAKQYQIGVLRGGYQQDYLILNGFKKNGIADISNNSILLDMLKKNRLSFILLSSSFDPVKLDPDLFEKALFAFSVTDYMAFSINTPLELVEKVRKAYRELANEGKIILEK